MAHFQILTLETNKQTNKQPGKNAQKHVNFMPQILNSTLMTLGSCCERTTSGRYLSLAP